MLNYARMLRIVAWCLLLTWFASGISLLFLTSVLSDHDLQLGSEHGMLHLILSHSANEETISRIIGEHPGEHEDHEVHLLSDDVLLHKSETGPRSPSYSIRIGNITGHTFLPVLKLAVVSVSFQANSPPDFLSSTPLRI